MHIARGISFGKTNIYSLRHIVLSSIIEHRLIFKLIKTTYKEHFIGGYKGYAAINSICLGLRLDDLDTLLDVYPLI